jgi:NIPSNAP protein
MSSPNERPGSAIVEMTITEVRPRTVPQALASFEQALPPRQRLSPLGGIWRTDAGALNQIIQIWSYDDLQHRDRVRAEEKKLSHWPPDWQNITVDQRTLILSAAPFSPMLTERRLGNIYEFRFYTVRRGSFAGIVERWAPAIERRIQFSPLVGVWYAEEGESDELVHVWGYRDANEWQSVRREVMSTGIWPPKARADDPDILLRQTSVIAIPAPFSPIR